MNNDRFEYTQTLYNAINDINNIVAGRSVTSDSTLLDDVLFKIKDIDKHDFDPEIEMEIIGLLKKAVVKIYSYQISQLNADIGLGDDPTIGHDKVEPKEYKEGLVFKDLVLAVGEHEYTGEPNTKKESQ